MFVTDEMIAAMAEKYGTPADREFDFQVTRVELDRIRSSQKEGRNHDVTVYIRHGDRLVVIAKHMYPADLYRAPSGGLRPGEQFDVGLAREVAEVLAAMHWIKPIMGAVMHFVAAVIVIFNSARLVRFGEELHKGEPAGTGPMPLRVAPEPVPSS